MTPKGLRMHVSSLQYILAVTKPSTLPCTTVTEPNNTIVSRTMTSLCGSFVLRNLIGRVSAVFISLCPIAALVLILSLSCSLGARVVGHTSCKGIQKNKPGGFQKGCRLQNERGQYIRRHMHITSTWLHLSSVLQ